jgi:general stress protein 26
MTDIVRKEIQFLVVNSHNAFVSSIDKNGFPNTKAMFALYHDGLKKHYFSTNLSSKRTSQFMENPKACIYFCNEKEYKGLMLIGIIKVCTDAYHKELLWREGYERYYPKGVTDEDYCVYEFSAHSGRYYHGLENFTFVMEDFDVNT